MAKPIIRKDSLDARGAGSITKVVYEDGTKNGLAKYRARIRIAGSMQDRSLDSLSEARDWLKAQRLRKDRVESGLEPLNRGTNLGITFGDIADEYLERVAEVGVLRRKRKPTATTLVSYRQQVSAVLREGWKRVTISHVTPDAVDAYVQRLSKSGLSTSTIRHRLDALSQMTEHAVRQRYLLTPPCRFDRPQLKQRSYREAASEDRLGAWLADAGQDEDSRLYLAILLAADAGLRRAEIVQLRCKHVQLRRDGDTYGSIHVAQESEQEGTKSGKGRDVPIFTKRLADALKRSRFGSDQRVLQPELKTASGLAQLARKSGVQLHLLRHRFGTRLAEQNENVYAIQRWMGHASVETTQRYLRGLTVKPRPGIMLEQR